MFYCRALIPAPVSLGYQFFTPKLECNIWKSFMKICSQMVFLHGSTDLLPGFITSLFIWFFDAKVGLLKPAWLFWSHCVGCMKALSWYCRVNERLFQWRKKSTFSRGGTLITSCFLLDIVLGKGKRVLTSVSFTANVYQLRSMELLPDARGALALIFTRTPQVNDDPVLKIKNLRIPEGK